MGIKIKREATKERKNVLGRKVVVNRNASGNEAVSKTRTVYSKSGGVISEKKSFKDRGSVAGKLLERKVDKSIAKRDRSNEKQESLRRKEMMKVAAKNVAPVMRKAIEEGRQEAGQQVARGAMNAGKVVQRVKMESKPVNNSYKMSASDSAKKYTQSEINKFTKKKP